MKSVIETVAKPANDTLEILSKVNEFYDSAWSKLIFLLAGTFAVLGIIVPIIIQHFQNKTLKANEKELESKMNQKIEEIRKELKGQVQKDLEVQMKNYTDKANEDFSILSGLLLDTIGRNEFEKENYYSALESFIEALVSYNNCDDKNNIMLVLDNILNCIELLETQEIKKFKLYKNTGLEEQLNISLEISGLSVIIHKIQSIREKIATFD